MMVTITHITPAFTDGRGDIMDIFEGAIYHTGIITFTPGAVRGNHYHKKQTQYTYMLNGSVELRVKDSTKPNSEWESHMLRPGDLVAIPPLITHAYHASEPATMLCLTNLSREGNGFEEDTYRIDEGSTH
jgi:quercetin dioxygenase-like cupin family protein